jgi:hypothetical protein
MPNRTIYLALPIVERIGSLLAPEQHTMKRKRTKAEQQSIHVWTYEQARAGMPYLASVMRSLREDYLVALQFDRQARQLASQPGRPDRATLIAESDARDDARRSRDDFEEGLSELQKLDVYCLDPIRGEALIPFVSDNQLAWYIYDLFDEENPLRYWRLHTDPLTARRPVPDRIEMLPTPTVIA